MLWTRGWLVLTRRWGDDGWRVVLDCKRSPLKRVSTTGAPIPSRSLAALLSGEPASSPRHLARPPLLLPALQVPPRRPEPSRQLTRYG